MLTPKRKIFPEWSPAQLWNGMVFHYKNGISAYLRFKNPA
jgi:hypothetical protein